MDKCDKWGIDDPVAWLNAVPPKVVDLWIAHEELREEEGHGEMTDPESAYDALTKAFT